MICKGAARGNGSQLAGYLYDYLTSEKNDRVELLELRGSAFMDLDQALRSWEAEAAGTRCTKPLWHAQICPDSDDKMTREQQLLAVDILEKHLGLQGQPRAVVMHENEGKEPHLHVVWSRIDRETGKAIRDDFSHKKNVAATAEIAARFGFSQLRDPFEQKTGDRRSRRAHSNERKQEQADQRKEGRTKLNAKDRKQHLTEAWNGTQTGAAFREAIEGQGYTLARGDRRDYVVVDLAGDIHSLARQIKGADAEQVRARMADVPLANLPTADSVRDAMRQARADRQREAEAAAPPIAAAEQDFAYSDRPIRTPDEPARKKPVNAAELIEQLTYHHATFSEAQLARAAVKLTDSGSAAAALIREVEESPLVVPLRLPGGPQRFTSRDMLETEMRMRHSADELAFRPGHPVNKERRDRAAAEAGLEGEQLRANRHITDPGDLKQVRGLAGSGKSYLLKPAHETWLADGYRVRGTALSGKAAEGLQEGSGIPSRTLHSLLYRLDNVDKMEDRLAAFDGRLARIQGRSQKADRVRADMRQERDLLVAAIDECKLNSRDIIVVDEAGMVGARQMQRLLAHAEKAGAKVVLIGDYEQLQAIEAGAAFRVLWDRHKGAELSSIESVRRQEELWQKQATVDLANQRTGEALDAYRDHGMVHQTDTADEAREQVIEHWRKTRAEHPDKTQIMLAYTRVDVAALNAQARETCRAEGKLNGDDVTIETADGKLAVAPGERLYFTKPNGRLDVVNGTLGTILEVNRHKLVIETDAGKRVNVDLRDFNNLAYGYAATIHKTQGLTVDRAHVLASRYMDRHSAYVSMSRHRKSADLFYAAEDFKTFDRLVGRLERDGSKDSTLDYLDKYEKGKSRPQRFRDAVAELWQKITGAFQPGHAAAGAKAPTPAPADTPPSSATSLKDIIRDRASEAARKLREELHRATGRGPDHGMER